MGLYRLKSQVSVTVSVHVLLPPVQVHVCVFLYCQLTLVKWPGSTSEQCIDGLTGAGSAATRTVSVYR